MRGQEEGVGAADLLASTVPAALGFHVLGDASMSQPCTRWVGFLSDVRTTTGEAG
jgi:hypothetical protein